MRAADLAALIPGAKQRGERWDALCPAHDDTRPSLTFHDDAARGRVGLLCRRGCGPDAIAAALGLSLADLHHEDRANGSASTGARASRSRVVAAYEYRDEGGVLLYVVERLEPKAFRQKRPDGRGGWRHNLDGVRRVLFGLAELRGHARVFIPEGEKDVLTLRALGLAATCNPQGAGKWADEYTRQLVTAGVRDVVILPDNDPPGRAHVDRVARSCHATGLRVRVIALPGLAEKEDVSDYFARGGTRETLFALVEAAAPVTAEELAVGASPRGGAVLVRFADVAPEAVTWLWPGRVARGKLTLLVGDPGLGKSFLTLDVGARCTRGGAWPDGGAAPLGDVILLSAEDGAADTLRPRLDALGADVTRVHLLRAVRAGDTERAFSLADDVRALEDAVAEKRAVLVVIDPVSAYLGRTDSYKDSEVRGLLAPLAGFAERTGAAVLAVMHLTKDAQRRALYRPGGSIAFTAAARVVLALAKAPEDEERRVLVSVKNNLAPPALALAFRIAGREGGGGPVTEWESLPVEGMDADSLLAAAGAGEEREERREAVALLRELLADGERPAADVQRAAREAGISERTLRRARTTLGVKVRRAGEEGRRGGGAWRWALSPAVNMATPSVPVDVATLIEPGEHSSTSIKVANPTAAWEEVGL